MKTHSVFQNEEQELAFVVKMISALKKIKKKNKFDKMRINKSTEN